MTLHTSGKGRREIRIPLVMDDGLYGIMMEPIQPDDPRYAQYPKCDVTPSGDFVLADDANQHGTWKTKGLAFASPSDDSRGPYH